MARPTDAQRILKALASVKGGKDTIASIAAAYDWTFDQAAEKVKRGVQAGVLFYSATTGMVTRKRKSASPDKGKVQSRRALGRGKARPTTPQAKQEQLELPLVATQAITESANG